MYEYGVSWYEPLLCHQSQSVVLCMQKSLFFDGGPSRCRLLSSVGRVTRGEPRRERRSPKVADGANSEKNQPKPIAEKASDGQDRRADLVPQAAPADAERGNVKWFNRTKGYGFIVRESGEEIFVHQRSVVPQTEGQRGALRDGQAVAFVVVEHDKGVQADRVTVVEA